MAKRDTLKELEVTRGDLHQVIPKLVNDGGQAYAAHQLNTTQSTISRWLKKNGYGVKVFWVLNSDARAAVAATLQSQPIRRESETV